MKKHIGFFLLLFISSIVNGQIKIGDQASISGSVQSDILFPEEDQKIGAGKPEHSVLTNTYLNLNFNSKYVSAGTRFEFLEYPLPGFEPDFKGWGLPYFFITGKYKNVELTAGDIYDQFGSGFILRTYEERSLGIDNSLRGGRLKVSPYKGIHLKVLGGKQRRYWEHNDSFVWGADAEFNFDQWIKKLEKNNFYWSLGTSFVSKHEKEEVVSFYDDEYNWYKRLNFPENVGAWDIRTQIQKGNVNVLLEYALKANDPSTDNYYIYKKGNASMLSASYSKKGMSALVQAKRIDNMSFRSKRTMTGNSSFINHLPAFTQQHTYALAAIYPYATQFQGEWAFQGEFSYTFPRKTALGGKYGTTIRVNASHVRSIDKDYENISGFNPKDHSTYYLLRGTNGYKSSFFKMGDELYYQDINFDIDKKLTSDLKINFMYMNQRFNPLILQHAEDIITSNIFVLEGKYQLNKKFTFRTELQYLSASDYTGQAGEEPLERSNQGDWMFGLLEVSFAPSFMLSVSDTYNSGITKEHYYMFSGVYNYKSHRIQLAYGRTRAGYDCSGGVCRFVPASKGFRIGYNYNF
ncbi:MAG: DUF6029 family protein [Bacteroidales bacterium]|nr:DUF6029 family protein [Bacteroidales bacterium]